MLRRCIRVIRMSCLTRLSLSRYALEILESQPFGHLSTWPICAFLREGQSLVSPNFGNSMMANVSLKVHAETEATRASEVGSQIANSGRYHDYTTKIIRAPAQVKRAISIRLFQFLPTFRIGKLMIRSQIHACLVSYTARHWTRATRCHLEIASKMNCLSKSFAQETVLTSNLARSLSICSCSRQLLLIP